MDLVDERIMNGYGRLLEAIAENRCRKYCLAYRAYLDKPGDVARKGKLYQAEAKLRSVPTEYTDGQIATLRHMTEERWGPFPQTGYRSKAIA